MHYTPRRRPGRSGVLRTVAAGWTEYLPGRRRDQRPLYSSPFTRRRDMRAFGHMVIADVGLRYRNQTS